MRRRVTLVDPSTGDVPSRTLSDLLPSRPSLRKEGLSRDGRVGSPTTSQDRARGPDRRHDGRDSPWSVGMGLRVVGSPEDRPLPGQRAGGLRRRGVHTGPDPSPPPLLRCPGPTNIGRDGLDDQWRIDEDTLTHTATRPVSLQWGGQHKPTRTPPRPQPGDPVKDRIGCRGGQGG